MSDRLFQDRRHAGRVLAGLLEHYRDNPDVVVLGLPRGGVPVAYGRRASSPRRTRSRCEITVHAWREAT